MKLRPIVVSLALALSVPIQAFAGSYDYAYQMYGASHSLPVQVFDDGKYTYLDFRGSKPDEVTDVSVVHSGGKVIRNAGEWDGQYLRLPGVFSSFHVRGSGVNAEIAYMGGDLRDKPRLVKADLKDPMVQDQPAASRVGFVPASNEHEMLRMPAFPVAAGEMPAPMPAKPLEKASLTKVNPFEIPFWYGRSSLGPKGKAVVDAIAAHAKEGGVIRVTTSGDGPSGGIELAKQRAQSVVSRLASLGVPKNRIEVVTKAEVQRKEGGVIYTAATLTQVVAAPATMAKRDFAKDIKDPRVSAVMDLWRAKLLDDVQAKVLLRSISQPSEPTMYRASMQSPQEVGASIPANGKAPSVNVSASASPLPSTTPATDMPAPVKAPDAKSQTATDSIKPSGAAPEATQPAADKPKGLIEAKVQPAPDSALAAANSAVAPDTPGASQKSSTTEGSNVVAPIATASPIPADVPAAPTLTLSPGIRLSDALKRFFAANTINVEWNFPGDLVIEEQIEFTGASYKEVAIQVFRRYGLKGTLYTKDRTLEISQKVLS